MLLLILYIKEYTFIPRSSDPFYIVSYKTGHYFLDIQYLIYKSIQILTRDCVTISGNLSINYYSELENEKIGGGGARGVG